jgi:multidrug efflux pump subunit AcrA (membrane-fusion protein)
VAPLTVVLALAAAGAVVAAVLVVGSGGGTAVQVSERTATVTRGVIQTIVSGSGNLEPLAQQDVDFATSGEVTKIYVHTGERIGKGDLIARVDSSTQQVAVDKAEAALADAEDALTKAQAAATATATAAATATATATTVAVAAQASPTGTPAPTAIATPARTPQATATAAPSQSGGGSTQSVASAEAAVESDQLALKQAQDDLAATELRAPMSGTVAAVNGAVGDDASSASSQSAAASSSSSASGFVVLADLRKLKMQVSLSESDIAKVHKGQSATVTINAASGEKVAGHVTAVGVLASSSSSSSSSSSGAVSYPVEVTLDQTTQGVKAGMSATADIVVAHASGLMVPSQALRGGSVTLVRNGRRSTQAVQTGVVGDSDTQVLSGLRAGDQVIVTSTTATLGAAASRAGGDSGTTGGFRGLGGAGGGFTPPGAGTGGLGGGGFRFRAGG